MELKNPTVNITGTTHHVNMAKMHMTGWTKIALQIYKAKELQLMLAKNGFKTLKQYSIDGSDFKKNKTISMLTLAQKKTFNQTP